MNTLSENLRRLMEEQGVTVKDLAERTDVSMPYLYQLLRNETQPSSVSYGVLERIATALGVIVPELTGEPGHNLVRKIRENMVAKDLRLVEAILSLDPKDWRYRAIFRILGIDFNDKGNATSEPGSQDNSDGHVEK